MGKVYFVTKNAFKFKSFTSEVTLKDFVFEQLSVETIEIQGKNNREIAEYSAEWAANKYKVSVVKEDIGLYIEALNGFPGPYLNFVDPLLKTEGYLKLMEGKSNRNAYWEYAVAYCEPGKKPISFYTHHQGIISREAQGTTEYYIPKLFIPTGQDKTISELHNEKIYVRDVKHYKKLEEYLSNNIEIDH